MNSLFLLSFVRTRVFDAYVVLMSMVVGASIPVLRLTGWQRHPRKVRWLLRLWSRSFITGARYILGMRYRFEGLENIPDRPVLFVGNHQSYWESITMTALIPHINVVTKHASMEIPVFGWGLRHAPMIRVDRNAPGANIRRLIRQGFASIREGRSILIFPEGGRVPVGETRPYQRGFEALYKKAGAPVIPFVTDAGAHWPAGLGVKRPGVVTLRFFPPVPPGRDPKTFAVEIERFLNAEKEKLRRESVLSEVPA